MKKGVNIWSFPSNSPVHASIKLAKEAGFDGIELALNETGELSLESKKQELLGYKAQAEDTGIALTSLVCHLSCSSFYSAGG
jgi:L-ribulose-5-phosphate 3-epimerase